MKIKISIISKFYTPDSSEIYKDGEYIINKNSVVTDYSGDNVIIDKDSILNSPNAKFE
jgi:hypothetical protein